MMLKIQVTVSEHVSLLEEDVISDGIDEALWNIIY